MSLRSSASAPMIKLEERRQSRPSSAAGLNINQEADYFGIWTDAGGEARTDGQVIRDGQISPREGDNRRELNFSSGPSSLHNQMPGRPRRTSAGL
jgi:hypothetical protein